MAQNPQEYHYVAHIDEAGDDGLKAVKPLSKPGASEWLTLVNGGARKRLTTDHLAQTSSRQACQ
jgi:hypothetical protein